MSPSYVVNWSTLGEVVLGLAFLLGLVAAVVVSTVLFAASRPVNPWLKIKGLLAQLIWIVPAAGLIGLIASRSERRFDRPVHTNPAMHAALESLREAQWQRHVAPSELHLMRLKTRQISTTAPEWAAGDAKPQGDGLLRLDSKLFASVEEAEDDVTAAAVTRLSQQFQGELGMSPDWLVPVELVEQHAVRNLVTEEVPKDFGNGITASMYRAHLQLDPGGGPRGTALRDAVQSAWRSQLVEQRVLVLGGILALVTLMLGTAASYFRLDEFTGGQYRGRLKVAAAAIIAAGGLVALQVVG